MTLDNSRWNVRIDGNASAPALLLLHGFTGCIAVWDDVVSALGRVVRIVRVDLPGHGRTEVPALADASAMESVSASFEALLQAVGIRNASVWGYSMGGRLALHFALHHPDSVDKLVLESSSPGIADDSERSRRVAEDLALADRIEHDGVAAFVEQWLQQPLFASQLRLPGPRQARARTLRQGHTARGLANSLRGMGTGAQPPLHALLPLLTKPTLILVGEEDAKFRAIGADMEGAMPDATVAVVPGCGHAPHWERPDLCAARVEAFLLGHVLPDQAAQSTISSGRGREND